MRQRDETGLSGTELVRMGVVISIYTERVIMLAQPIRLGVKIAAGPDWSFRPYLAHTVRDPSAGGTTASMNDARWRFPVGRVRYA